MSDERKRLLIVAPAFPPHPSPATHRARFLARHAPECGWSVEVLTVRPQDYEEPPDHALTRLLPPDLQVTRAKAWPARWTRAIGVGDLGLRSLVPLLRAARRVVARRRPDLLFVSAPPFYTFLVAKAIWREAGVPYVLDYTDPWVHPLPADLDRPTRKAYWSHRLAAVLEPSVVRDAAHLLAVSDATHAGVRARHPEIPAERFSAIPFGFEAADFDAARRDGSPNPFFARGEETARNIVYVGAVPTSMAETIRALFAAAGELRRRDPDLYDLLHFHFVGTSYGPRAGEGLVTQLAREAGLREKVTERTARVPYTTALRILSDADVILALGSADRHYTASKIFNCILAGPPLVTLFHEESPVVDFVRRTAAGELLTYGSARPVAGETTRIADALARALVRSAESARARDLRPLDEFSARSMTRDIFAVAERCLAGGTTSTRDSAAAYSHA